jgi:hypothetical protein
MELTVSVQVVHVAVILVVLSLDSSCLCSVTVLANF